MNNINLDWLKSLIEQQAKKQLHDAAVAIRNELYEEAKFSIEMFYNDWQPSVEPIYYKRRYYNFYNHAFKPYFNNSHGNYLVGIELTPFLINDIYRQKRIYSEDWDSPEEVFNRVFMEGKHGVGGPYTESPYEYLIDVRDDIVKNINDYI